MDGAVVFRLISLVPDRMPRGQTGSLFAFGNSSTGAALPIPELARAAESDHQGRPAALGVRAVAAKPTSEGEEPAGDLMDRAEDDDEEAAPINPPGAGTQMLHSCHRQR